MAKELLVTRDLNREMLEAGAALADELESQNFGATVVMWLYLEEFDRWRVVIASPDVDNLGPREVYSRLRVILGGMSDSGGLTLSDIYAIGDKISMVKTLREAASEPGGVEEGRVSGSVPGDYIDAYIYQVKPLETDMMKD